MSRSDIADRSSFHSARLVQARARHLLWWMVAVCIAGAFVGHLLVVRSVVRDASIQAAAEHGRRITLLLEQAGMSPQRREAQLQAYFDQHRLVLLEQIDAGGEVAFRRLAPAEPERLPIWSRWLAAKPEVVEIALPARAGLPGAGRLRLQAPMADLDQRLWRYSQLFAGVLGLTVLTALVLGLTLLRRLQRPIGGAGSQAGTAGAPTSPSAASSTIFAEPASEPAPMERTSARRLRKLARLEGLVVAQANELDELRRQAQVDTLTGLSNRRDSMARLYATLEGPTALADAQLLLLRVSDLPSANRRVGYDVSDEILRALAAALRRQVEGDERSVCGRMNGSDFVFLRPGASGARASAEAVLAGLRSTLVALDPQCRVAVGVVKINASIDVARALSLADEALARAEAGPAFSIAEIAHAPDLVAFGDSVWQQRLAAALECNHTRLAGFPVCARDGRLLYLDCPMHVRFDEHGEHEPALRWLPPAMRGRLAPKIDLHVLRMAIEAIGEDGQQRCINVAAQSLASSDFIVQATCALESAGDAATRLWIDVPESLAVDHRDLVVEACRRWWPLGVRLALEHAGEQLGHVEGLGTLGLDSVRIDARFVCGLTGPESDPARKHLQGLVRLVHSAGLSITAEGVRLAGDLAVLWALGFDAATGPAVLKRGHSISPK